MFFDDVKVPVENLVGQENKGWDYAKFLLGNERTGIARVGISKERVRRIKELAAIERCRRQAADRGRALPRQDRRGRGGAEGARDDADARRRRRAHTGNPTGPIPASSILKIKGTEIQQAITELAARGGRTLRAALRAQRGRPPQNEPSDGPEWAAPIAPTYFNYRKISIYGGSNEIQKNIIAKAVLGL